MYSRRLSSQIAVLLAAGGLSLALGCARPQSTAPGEKRFIVLMNNNSPFWDAVGEGVKKAAEELGVNAVLFTNDGTEQGQITSLQQFATQSDIAAVGVSVLKADVIAIADEMRNLQSKGIKVITIDSDVNRELYRDARTAFVGTNNYEAGKELGVAAQALRPGGAKYVTFVGQLTAQNAIERISGFEKGAGADAESLDSMEDSTDRPRARENVRNAISNHPEMNTLVGIWSYNAPAIVDVVKERNVRDKFTICTFDAEPVAIEAMEEGDIEVMMVQNPYEMGYQGVRLMKALVDDEQGVVKEMFPSFGQEGGDTYDTGLRVVVPDGEQRITPDLFGDATEFFQLSDFRAWLAERGLEGS